MKYIFFSLIFVCLIIGAVYLISGSKQQTLSQNAFKMQLGTYQLDLIRTSLGKYSKDSALYSKLKITFYNDSSFKLNFDVPFIYESSGRWLAGGRNPENWNRMFYKSWKFPDESYEGDQFSSVWTKDSIFYINGATSKDKQDFIQEIYFRKVINAK